MELGELKLRRYYSERVDELPKYCKGLVGDYFYRVRLFSASSYRTIYVGSRHKADKVDKMDLLRAIVHYHELFPYIDVDGVPEQRVVPKSAMVEFFWRLKFILTDPYLEELSKSAKMGRLEEHLGEWEEMTKEEVEKYGKSDENEEEEKEGKPQSFINVDWN